MKFFEYRIRWWNREKKENQTKEEFEELKNEVTLELVA